MRNQSEVRILPAHKIKLNYLFLHRGFLSLREAEIVRKSLYSEYIDKITAEWVEDAYREIRQGFAQHQENLRKTLQDGI